MFDSLVIRAVAIASRHPWRSVCVALVVTAGSVVYVAGHFAINTDVGKLIDSHEPWAERERALEKAFPDRADQTLIVIEAPAIEWADAAARELAASLEQDPQHFRVVLALQSGPFFRRNALLFLPEHKLTEVSRELGDARPLLNALARDPSLRGLSNLLATTLIVPLQTGQLTLADLRPVLQATNQTLESVAAGKPAALSWEGLLEPSLAASRGVARSYVLVHPVVDYAALEAGQDAARAIRSAAAALRLDARYAARLRLTGPIPLADEEFASVEEGAVPNALATLGLVVLILWLALRSAKLVAAVFVILIAGLAVTAALGLLMVGALNMISVAFAVLFVGIGVDFSIQFGVRLREERHRHADLGAALAGTARSIALPLTLAALATAASFFSFLPTAYRGVSELGLIAGVGILFVAFPSSITLLPALARILRPKVERAPPGIAALAPLDAFLERHRVVVLTFALVGVVAAAPLLLRLQFDFDPLHLKDPHSESMATLLDLQESPEAGVDNVQVLADSPDDAASVAVHLGVLGEVGSVTTLESFVPDDQSEKLAIIAPLAALLHPILTQEPAAPATDLARVNALKNAARQLDAAALDYPGPGAAEATALAATLRKLAMLDAAARDRAEAAIAGTLRLALGALAEMLEAAPISDASLPPALVHEWRTASGASLVEIGPRASAYASADRNASLARFAEIVARAEPRAVGGPISILASAHTIIHAFEEAALYALISITLLLWWALRRFGDVLRTLIPLLVSATVTLELCVVFGIPLNFANIIALPLLLGIGVAFKIYYVLAWRRGQTGFLQSSLTQAVILSAATTATAFGSLWFSHHPGTSSMGQLLTLSLLCTLGGAVLFQPVLMGRPRPRGATGEVRCAEAEEVRHGRAP